MYSIKQTGQFKKDLKTIHQRHYDLSLLKEAIDILAGGEELPLSYRDHALLGGDYPGCRECHIQPDWLLVYKISGNDLILYLIRSGTHSDLFR